MKEIMKFNVFKLLFYVRLNRAASEISFIEQSNHEC